VTREWPLSPLKSFKERLILIDLSKTNYQKYNNNTVINIKYANILPAIDCFDEHKQKSMSEGSLNESCSAIVIEKRLHYSYDLAIQYTSS
jgi:hypothetical protein